MAKDLRISFLLDFYGDMLTDTQREVVDAYRGQIRVESEQGVGTSIFVSFRREKPPAAKE